MSLNDSQLQLLHEELARCSEATIERAVQYQTDRNPEHVLPIVFGILERYVPKANLTLLREATAETTLGEGLGLDSITLLEVVMTAEIVFGIHVENRELMNVRTIGSMEEFIREKVAAHGS